MTPEPDATLLRRAAAAARGTYPHPNPRVGALVLGADGSVLGVDAHQGPGAPHAEVAALDRAGEAARGSTLYVTLEPCVHHGCTPPCVDALVGSQVARVVVGALDPDERVSGRGVAALEAAGVEVTLGVDGVEAEEIDPGYFHHRRTGRPRVTLKSALTLDGQSAAADHSSRWITSPEAREDAHRLRAASDAVMVGAGTALADDPELTVRIDGWTGAQPRPVVVAGRRGLSPDLRLLARDPVVLSPRPADLPGTVVVSPDTTGDRVDLTEAMTELGRLGIVDLLVEGGAGLAGALWSAGLVDRWVIYLAGRVAGGIGIPALAGEFSTVSTARPVVITEVRRVGADLRVEVMPGR